MADCLTVFVLVLTGCLSKLYPDFCLKTAEIGLSSPATHITDMESRWTDKRQQICSREILAELNS